jgi:hypothetical protein
MARTATSGDSDPVRKITGVSVEIRQEIESGAVVQVMIQDDDIEFFGVNGNGPGLGDRTGGFALVRRACFSTCRRKAMRST